MGISTKRAIAACGASLAVALTPCVASAQDEAQRVQQLERKLEESLRLIDQLNRRLEALEKGKPATTAAPASASAAAAPAPATQARIEALEKTVTQMASTPSTASEALRGIPLHGFADVGYEHTGQPRTDTRKSGFVLGNLDLFLTPEFGRVRTLAELVFEVDESGGLATDLERLQLGYTFSDALTGWVGRFHTPYGYWNAAFHHGAQIQTAVTRPRFIDFEDKGGILPAHAVGIWLTGHTRALGGNWQYDAWLANGNRIQDGVLDFNARRDDNSNKFAGVNVGYRLGGALDGAVVGVHAMQQDVSVYVEGDAVSRTRMAATGAWLYVDTAGWEAIGEYYRFRNKDLMNGGGTHSSWAGFLQVGYTFADLWTPYYRWEKAALDASDAYFAAQESGRPYSRNSLGLRFALNPNTAVKLEGNRTREILGEEKSYSEWRAQLAVRF